MLSTMQDGQFSLADLLQYTRRVHADVEVTTWTEDEPRRTTYGEVGRDAARLAHALRGLGVTGDQRVATFMWNNAEHLTAYFAIPAMVLYCGVEPDQFHDGWLRTGDVGRISPDGYLTLTDRAKDVIKSGGEWISSIELENQMMAHPAVAEATSIGVPDERWGERPLLAVVLHTGHHATPAELRAFLSGRVPGWQLPERWAFVAALPKTSVGKADKKRLRELYAKGALDLHHMVVQVESSEQSADRSGQRYRH